MLTQVDNIPEELKKVAQWVCAGKADKIPKSPYNGKNAKSNDPKTWGTFEQAVKACETFGFEYLGFEFAPPYVGVDLDHCLNNSDFCDEFVESLESYAEISRSGQGLHIICKGKLPEGNRRKGDVEMYSEGRYFILTGNLYNENYREVRECNDNIKVLHNKYMPDTEAKVSIKKTIVDLRDEEVIDKARNCKSGGMFSLLYSGDWQGYFPSQSEADIAFCNQLAFWTGRNEIQMDRIFRSSGLMREKWDKRRGADTYGNITIGRACASCKEVYEPGKYDDTTLAISFFSNNSRVDKPAKYYDKTDTGNAERLYDKFGNVLKYLYNRKKWYVWTGKRWSIDEGAEIKKLADIVCREMKAEAFQCDEDKQKEELKWATRTANSRPKEAMIKECQHLHSIPASPENFDAHTDLLNVQNGIIDLKTGELMPHDSSHMLSKITYCDYDAGGNRPEKWLKFLDDVTAGDKDLQEYIQRCVGYSITGSNREQCAYFLYGMGNNGKSTFLDTIANVLGDYAANTQPDTLMMQGKVGSLGGGANTEIARLKSARFVTCEEPTEGVRLNEGLLKQITGGTKVTCRFLYGDEFEYTPEFKIWVATNHKPTIRGTDVGIWRRIKLIPFEVNIPPEKVDKSLKYKLRAEYPQILAWAMEGCMKWQKYGLNEPKRVIEAVKDYKQEMDLIASFVEQCIVIDYACDDKIMASELFALYKSWAKENNEWEMTSKRFGMELGKKTPEKLKTAKGIAYGRIRLTEYARTLLPRQYSIKDFK